MLYVRLDGPSSAALSSHFRSLSKIHHPDRKAKQAPKATAGSSYFQHLAAVKEQLLAAGYTRCFYPTSFNPDQYEAEAELCSIVPRCVRSVQCRLAQALA